MLLLLCMVVYCSLPTGEEKFLLWLWLRNLAGQDRVLSLVRGSGFFFIARGSTYISLVREEGKEKGEEKGAESREHSCFGSARVPPPCLDCSLSLSLSLSLSVFLSTPPSPQFSLLVCYWSCCNAYERNVTVLSECVRAGKLRKQRAWERM